MAARSADDVSATLEALRRIEADGSDMSRPMSMDFFVSVPSLEAGQVVASRAEQLGFSTEIERDQGTDEWTCYCTVTLVPEVDAVSSLEKKLDEVAREVGGHGDGFGSFGNKD